MCSQYHGSKTFRHPLRAVRPYFRRNNPDTLTGFPVMRDTNIEGDLHPEDDGRTDAPNPPRTTMVSEIRRQENDFTNPLCEEEIPESTRKTTVYLDRESLGRIAAIQQAYGIATKNKAIRKAIELATSPLNVDIHVLAETILWAQKRPFQTPREKSELYEITRASYEVLKRHSAAVAVQAKPEQLPRALRSLIAIANQLPSDPGTRRIK